MTVSIRPEMNCVISVGGASLGGVHAIGEAPDVAGKPSPEVGPLGASCRKSSERGRGGGGVSKPHRRAPKALGRRPAQRAVVNALLDVRRAGCPWRLRPPAFPPRSTGQRACAAGREAARGAGKPPASGGPRGGAAGKKRKGRKRHRLTAPGSLLGAAPGPAATSPGPRRCPLGDCLPPPRLPRAAARLRRQRLCRPQARGGAGARGGAHIGRVEPHSRRLAKDFEASDPPPGSSSPAFNSSPDAWQKIENKYLLMGQPLRLGSRVPAD